MFEYFTYDTDGQTLLLEKKIEGDFLFLPIGFRFVIWGWSNLSD